MKMSSGRRPTTPCRRGTHPDSKEESKRDGEEKTPWTMLSRETADTAGKRSVDDRAAHCGCLSRTLPS